MSHDQSLANRIAARELHRAIKEGCRAPSNCRGVIDLAVARDAVDAAIRLGGGVPYGAVSLIERGLKVPSLDVSTWAADHARTALRALSGMMLERELQAWREMLDAVKAGA